MKKITISINDELLDRLDTYAAENYLNRSGVISLSVKQYLDGQQMISELTNLAEVLKQQKPLTTAAANRDE